VRAAPFVRKLARDLGVPLEDVAGSGAHGRVRIADVEARAAPPAEPAPAAQTIPLRGLRKSIADHMVQAWRNAPQVTSMDLLDVTELVRARDLLQSTAQEQGARLTYLPFFVKAAVAALKAVPIANAVVDEQKSVIVLEPEYHIGIATAVPDGLVVPVVKHADRLSLLEIAREIERLVRAARERRAVPADLTGGTFTITSFGGLPGGPLFATPILNYPQVAILGLGRIDLQPRVVDGQVVARQCLGVSFTFDHRALDGAAAGQFMSSLKKYLAQPLELLVTLR
jgi:pyruvate dehydrogenase E2 component (dihydrolipoamide acetyltransferase)